MDSMKMHSLSGVLDHRFGLHLTPEQMFDANTSIAWIVKNRVPLNQQKINDDGSVIPPQAPFEELAALPSSVFESGSLPLRISRDMRMMWVFHCFRRLSAAADDGRARCATQTPRNGILSEELPVLRVLLLAARSVGKPVDCRDHAALPGV